MNEDFQKSESEPLKNRNQQRKIGKSELCHFSGKNRNDSDKIEMNGRSAFHIVIHLDAEKQCYRLQGQDHMKISLSTEEKKCAFFGSKV